MSDNEAKKMKLAFRVSNELNRKIEEAAEVEGVSKNQYITDAVLMRLNNNNSLVKEADLISSMIKITYLADELTISNNRLVTEKRNVEDIEADIKREVGKYLWRI